MNSQTMTEQSFQKGISIKDFADANKIPYIYVKISKNGHNSKGEDQKKVEGLITGFPELTYDQAMLHNQQNRQLLPKHMMLILRHTQFMVVDVDNVPNMDEEIMKYGDTHYTRSVFKKTPHFYRRKDADDNSKNKISAFDKKIDLIYEYIYENVDSMMKIVDDEMPIFDYKQFHPKPVSKTATIRRIIKKLKIKTKISPQQLQRFKEHLENIDAKYFINYEDWFKIGFACKSVFGDLELFKDASDDKANGKHKPSTTDWDKKFEGESQCGIPTLLYYSKLSSEEQYEDIEKKYKKNPDEGEDESDYLPYAEIKITFEETFSKILSLSVYAKTLKDGSYQFYSAKNFITSYQHIKCWYNGKAKSFVSVWSCDPSMKIYESVEMYPPPLVCPPEILNIWTGFAIAKETGEYTPNEKGLELFKSHINILCNHQPNVADYVIRWIAQMFQYPAVKTTALTFISGEGAGKGTLLYLLNLMMGGRKVFETTEPSRDVWGSFNTLMANAFLVNLNEMSLKEAKDAEGKIKGLITDSAMTINNKGVSAYSCVSYHRFIITSNNADPITVKKNDRRNIVIQSSDEKIGNRQYFIDINKEFDDINVRRTIYDYLMSIKDLENFKTDTRPITEYQTTMVELSRSHYDRFIEYIALHNAPNEKYEKSNELLISTFNKWLKRNHITFETNSIKLGIALTRMKNPAILKNKHTNHGNGYTFDIPSLRQQYTIPPNFIAEEASDE